MAEGRINLNDLIKPTDGPISRYINRRISTRITAFIVLKGIPLTPNQISVFSFILGVIAGIAFIKGHLILGGVLTQLSSIIDGVDGELARVKNMASKRGGFLDTMLDRLADIAICLGMILYLINTRNITLSGYVISFLAITGCILPPYLAAEVKARDIKAELLVPIYRPPASRDVRLFILFLGGITGYILISLAIVAFITYINTAMKILFIYFRLKE